MGVIERRDQRLNHAEGTVESARIAPGFQVVRFGDVPVAEFGSLVKMRADVNGILDGLPIFLPVENTDRKSTRLNSSHDQISYAVFCLKKKKKINEEVEEYSRSAD